MATATLVPPPQMTIPNGNGATRYYTPEEYLALEAKSEEKNEYRDGRITPLGNPNGDSPMIFASQNIRAGASPNHSRIVTNFIMRFGLRLDELDCEVFASDLRVYAPNGGIYTYPDVSVVRGTPEFDNDMLLNPVLLVEVLSDFTEAYDRGDKFRRYQTIESLMDYLLISQNRPRIEHFARQGDRQWLLSAAEGMDASLTIPSLEITLSLADIFAKVEFEAPRTEPTTEQVG